ncbi:radical SAM protein (plasmid) [Nocardia sp. CWNU-33]|uniref:radical SAM protein n=1 Tax=Nocardia sp. CWNU-33 TaxID=3392117 RepID=UPI00398E3CBA
MYTVSDLRQLHLEVSTRCNAECPMCARNLFGSTAPGLVETSMTLDKFRTCLPDDVLAQLEIVDICGAYGDPAIAPELLDICRHIHATSPTARIRIYSNGGLRTPQWWTQLAEIPDIATIFAIDGLATNEVYRRKVDIDKVLRNAKAFIDAGGRAQWDYIAFAHNEHEIDAARAHAAELGFDEFQVKKTARFLRPLYEPAPELRPGDGIDAAPIYDRTGRVVGELRPPADERLVNEVVLWARSIEARAEYFDEFFDTCTIQCQALDSSAIFLAATGHVYPCCWLYVQATLPQLYGTQAVTDQQVHDLLTASGGPATLDAAQHPLDDILASSFFTAVERSWTADSIGGGKLKVCSRVCGEGFSAYRRQFDRPDLVP